MTTVCKHGVPSPHFCDWCASPGRSPWPDVLAFTLFWVLFISLVWACGPACGSHGDGGGYYGEDGYSGSLHDDN